LRALVWRDYEQRLRQLLSAQYGPGSVKLQPGRISANIVAALQAYFAGDCHAIDSIEAEARGTPFQQSVWQALRRIPSGTTCSYRDLAIAIGRPQAVRAVGAANGANPICIVVPCHRVIGANGDLTGYGGGLERKRWLLRHEKVPERFGEDQSNLPFGPS
jgi:methylated-DNA-[protein]-cysteine S-methyltransferase